MRPLPRAAVRVGPSTRPPGGPGASPMAACLPPRGPGVSDRARPRPVPRVLPQEKGRLGRVCLSLCWLRRVGGMEPRAGSHAAGHAQAARRAGSRDQAPRRGERGGSLVPVAAQARPGLQTYVPLPTQMARAPCGAELAPGPSPTCADGERPPGREERGGGGAVRPRAGGVSASLRWPRGLRTGGGAAGGRSGVGGSPAGKGANVCWCWCVCWCVCWCWWNSARSRAPGPSGAPGRSALWTRKRAFSSCLSSSRSTREKERDREARRPRLPAGRGG